MTTEFLPRVGPEVLDDIQRLCTRSFTPVLTSSELAKSLFAPDQPAVVRFSPSVGVVATVREQQGGSIRLIAVDPSCRMLGNGHRLVQAAERDLEGARVVTVGADPPYFLFPGVPAEQTALCYLLERHHFSREESNYNVVVELAELPAGAGEAEDPLPKERGAIDAWSTEHWPNWRAELLRAFDQGSLLVTRDLARDCGCMRVRREPQRDPGSHRIAPRSDRKGRRRGAPARYLETDASDRLPESRGLVGRTPGPLRPGGGNRRTGLLRVPKTSSGLLAPEAHDSACAAR